MTWLSRSRFVLARLLPVVLGLATLSCGSPHSSYHSVLAPAPPHCAELMAQAMASPAAPVQGAFACMSPEYQAINVAAGITSDQDLMNVAAQPPIFTQENYVGHSARGYYFQYGGDAGVGCFRFHVNAAGLVDRVAFNAITCPNPLP